MEEQEQDIKQTIIDAYIDVIKTKKGIPSAADLVGYGITRDKIRNHFGNMDKLHVHISENYATELGEHFSTVDNLFNDKRGFESRRYIVTTAVADSVADIDFLNSLKSYSKQHDAEIVILPCESITNSFEKRTAVFDREFNDPIYRFISSDQKLNDNLSLCSIQVSAKQIKPITGLSRIGHREGSYIFASPKQFLEYIPSGNSRNNNFAIMTPGACTKPQYFTETFVSKRLSYIAAHDHGMGAIIVEIEDDKAFHFRQIQADENGSFIDLGVEYHSDGSSNEVPVNVVLGDIHSAQLDYNAVNALSDLTKDMDVQSIYLHDLFDGHSINHHIQSIGAKSARAQKGMHMLYDEIANTRDTLIGLANAFCAKNTYVVRSNHDEFLDRYLSEGRYVDDPENHYFALQIAPALFEDVTPLQRAIDMTLEHAESESTESRGITFLHRSSNNNIGGVHVASHGDKGLNGAKASLNSLEKIYGDCVTAHVHTAAIQRGVFRVGTMSNLDMGYNSGPSSWTQTSCLVYENGQRQLVNYVNGKYCKDQKSIYS